MIEIDFTPTDGPEWSSAPPWAFWWAVDADGTAHWHQIRPVMRDGAWLYHEGPGDHNGWNKKDFDRAVVVADWTQTLRERVTKPTLAAPISRSTWRPQRTEARRWWDDDDDE